MGNKTAETVTTDSVAGREVGLNRLDDCVYVYDFLNRTVGLHETATDGCVDPDAEPDDDGNYMLTLHDPLNREIAHLTSADATVDLDAIAAAGINSSATFTAQPNTDLEIDIRIYGIGDHLSRTHTSDHTGGSVVTDVGFYEPAGRILRHTNTNDPAETQLLGTDGHGNITTITSVAGAAVCERFYEPFGTEHDASDCTDDDTINQRWYRGGVQNDTDGTYTYGSRHYDPETGTWTTPDTARPQAPLTDLSIGTDPLTQNRYSYVNGDPVNLVDPTGHRVCQTTACTVGYGDTDVWSMSDDEQVAFSDHAEHDRECVAPSAQNEDECQHRMDWDDTSGGFDINAFAEGFGSALWAPVELAKTSVLMHLEVGACAVSPLGFTECEFSTIFDFLGGLSHTVTNPTQIWRDCMGDKAHCAGEIVGGLALGAVGKGVSALNRVPDGTPSSLNRIPDGAPSAAGIRGLAGAGDDLAQGGVYALRDPVTGQIVRTGRTNSLTRRAGEHLRNPALSDYDFEVIARTDVYAQQRGLEQLLHDAYSPELNRIRPISPTNPSRSSYLEAADDFLSRYGGG